MKDLILVYTFEGKEIVFPVNRPITTEVNISEGFLTLRFSEVESDSSITMELTYDVPEAVEEIIQEEDTDFYDRAIPEIYKSVRQYLVACIEVGQKIVDLNLLDALIAPKLTELAIQSVQNRLDNPIVEPDIQGGSVVKNEAE